MNNFINDEKISITKQEYENLKMYENEFVDFEFSDFVLKMTKGAVIPKTNPNYNNNRIDIKIINQEKHSIFIDGQEYAIKSLQLYNKIKKFVSDNLNTLINWSVRQNKFNLDNNCYEGGISRCIKVKYGNLIIIVNGQVSDIGNLCDQFIEEVKQLIINEGHKTSEDYMMELFEKIEPQTPTPLDEEFDKYCKLYEEKFGNKVTIPEPSGTKEFVIECIKKCLQENKDILGDLCYPNFKKDMENGVLYSEQNIANTDELSNNDKISYEEYRYIFEKDNNGCYVRLVIPEEDNFPELNLIGKSQQDFTTDEVIRMKKYANKMFNKVDKQTMNNLEQNDNSNNDDENLKTIIQEVISNNQEIIGNDTQYCNTIVYDIMKKIIDLPNETTSTIASLINYNPNEAFVEPITQGQIRRLVKEVCKKLNIKLEDNKDKLGGLAYYNEFKKVNNEKDTNNGVLYSETKQDLRSNEQNLNTFDDDRKTIEFLCNNCGTSTSMSFRRKFTTGNKVYARCTNCGNEISSDNPFNEAKPNLNNDKFVWKEGEIKIVKTLCELCKHNDKEHPNVCSQYPNGKPNEVISNNIKCPEFDNKNKIDL